ncbi:MAG TPA: metal-dependent transcriptional regulator, partial [Thermoanaerobaculia bacterium]|nr:metal-dependent transcriptional regulator [Thermoanaerobaculia bacterium]
TAAGRQLALHVLRRHRLIEQFLVQVMGMDWSRVHAEADRLEHAVSDELVDRMDELLGRPAVDPHGDPIPDRQGVVSEPQRPSLAACPVDVPLRVARVTDQSSEFLQLVERHGLMPGSEVTVAGRDAAADTVRLRLTGRRRLELGLRAASKILVE